MPIEVVCAKCGLRLKAPDAAAGKRVRCKCGEAIAVPDGSAQGTAGGAPASRGAAPSAPASPGPSLFDVLTERDVQQAQINPYAPAPKATTSDGAALRTYLKGDDDKKAKAKANETNLILLTVGFFLGVVKNGFAITAILVLSAILPGLMEQASQAEPLLQLGSLFLVISVVYLFYDLATAIGLILRKGWGWWLTVIGLAWTACERVFSAVTFVMLVEEKAQAIGAVIGASVVMIICLSLLNFMVQPETQKRFGVDVKPGIVWVVALAVGLLLSGIAYGIGMAAGLQLEQALPTPPPVPPPG